MFIPALKNLGTHEQQKEWLSRAWDCKIIGAYAQTEMGHGTFIRGLETTATYDPRAKEFVIHSPTISAYKVSTCEITQRYNFNPILILVVAWWSWTYSQLCSGLCSVVYAKQKPRYTSVCCSTS